MLSSLKRSEPWCGRNSATTAYPERSPRWSVFLSQPAANPTNARCSNSCQLESALLCRRRGGRRVARGIHHGNEETAAFEHVRGVNQPRWNVNARRRFDKIGLVAQADLVLQLRCAEEQVHLRKVMEVRRA